MRRVSWTRRCCQPHERAARRLSRLRLLSDRETRSTTDRVHQWLSTVEVAIMRSARQCLPYGAIVSPVSRGQTEQESPPPAVRESVEESGHLSLTLTSDVCLGAKVVTAAARGWTGQRSGER